MANLLSVRLDSITPGSILELDRGPDIIPAIFLGVNGKGDTREAIFVSPTDSGRDIENWSGFRHNGRWATGQDKHVLRVLDIIFDNTPLSDEDD